MDVRVGLWRKLSAKELMLLNCGVGEDSWESHGLQGDQPWDFFGKNDAKAETPVLWPPHVKSWVIGKDWCWEGLGAGGEGDDTEWDGWMASLTRWTWVWVNSGSWWWTGGPGELQFMGSQRVGHDWATELNWLIFPVSPATCSSGSSKLPWPRVSPSKKDGQVLMLICGQNRKLSFS